MISEEIKKNVLEKLESIRVCGSKAELWNFEAGTILRLINEEQREIDELKEHIRKRIAYTQDLEKDLFENCENYVVSKDKIRDKIKELEEEKNNYFEKQVIQGRIDLLKELLEGE